MTKKQYVYLIRALNARGLCKIGKTHNRERRLKEHKVSPKEIIEVVQTKDMQKLESLLHTVFMHRRVPGTELFDLSDKEIQKCKKLMNDSSIKRNHPQYPKDFIRPK